MYTSHDIRNWLQDHYDLRVTSSSKLVGEADENWRIDTIEGQRFILKITLDHDQLENIEFQIAILNYLSEKNLSFKIPQVVESNSETQLVWINSKDQKAIMRLHTWVEGELLDDVVPKSNELLYSWGKTCGELNTALLNFDHPGAHQFYKWNPSETLHSRKYLKYISDNQKNKLANQLWDYIEEIIYPKLIKLRKQVNHNDAHQHNLLADINQVDAQVVGVIDFGDAMYTELINELAIACAYAGMKMPDPIAAISKVVSGFYSVQPLLEEELEVLYGLITGRLLITVSNAAYQLSNNPGNEYLQISSEPAWDLLFKLKQVDPNFFYYSMRQACGLVPHPSNKKWNNWVGKHIDTFISIVDTNNCKIGSIDLSIGSKALGANRNFESTDVFCKRVEDIMDQDGLNIAIGGYCEFRPVYTTESYQHYSNEGIRWRTGHLGIDIWMVAGSGVYAPLDGKVYSCTDNKGERNYGPTIIIEHIVDDQQIFYTLYGHLSRASLEHIHVGQTVKAGDQIAAIGPPPENGSWPPHLHFQILLDLLGNTNDFPGVCTPDEIEIWKSICPDPIHLLTSDFQQALGVNVTLDSIKILEKRKKYLGPNLSLSYHSPLHIVRGAGVYLYEKNGRKYLDTVNNVAHVGHEHPRILDAIRRQSELLNTNTRYLNEEIVCYAEALQSTFPDPLSVVYFVNSGSEANELAIRMAKAYQGRNDFIAVEHGYHGNSNACVDLSSYKFDGKGGSGRPCHTHLVAAPDLYRGKYHDPKTAGSEYANAVDTQIELLAKNGIAPAAFICESILSCGGQIVLPDNYLQEIYSKIRKIGGLCIADEVQVGFGRVGEHFWGFELQGVVPDIVVMGKPIGNGHPLAAVVTTREVAEAFNNGMEYFNTFGGNPVSCSVGREVLNIVKDEDLQNNAKQTGDFLLDELRRLQVKHKIIGDVRGHGLFLGIELVLDRESKIPAMGQAKYIVNQMRNRGVLMSRDGPLNNVIKIKPPIIFSQSHAQFLIHELELVLNHTYILKSLQIA